MALENYYYPIVIQRKTSGKNAYGAPTESWSTHLTVRGLIDWVSDKGINSAGQWQTQLRPIMLTATGQDIKQYDRVVVGGKTYNITNMPDNIMNRNHHFEIDLEVVTGG